MDGDVSVEVTVVNLTFVGTRTSMQGAGQNRDKIGGQCCSHMGILMHVVTPTQKLI